MKKENAKNWFRLGMKLAEHINDGFVRFHDWEGTFDEVYNNPRGDLMKALLKERVK
jgi:predicted porin